MNKAQKAKWNTATSLIYQVLTIIFSFITPRLIIQFYGSEINGLISSYVKFFSFISILRIGLVSSVRFTLYKPLAERNKSKVSGILVSTEKYMRRIAFIFLPYAVIVVCMFPYFTHSNISPSDMIFLGLIVSIGVFSEYYFGITYQTLLSADQKLFEYTIMQIISTVFYNIIAIFLILNRASIYSVRIIYAVIFTIGPFIIAKLVIKQYDINRTSQPIDDAYEMRKDAIAQSIANIIHDTVDVAVITLFLNISMVSVYAIYYLVISGINSIFSVLTSGLEPAFGRYWADEDFESFRNNFHTMEYICAFVIITLFSSIFILFLPFIKLYTNNITDAIYVLPVYAILTVCVALTNAFREPYTISVQAAGKYKDTKFIAIGEAIINLVISIVSVKYYGIYGAVIGTIIANSYRTIRYALFTYKKLIKQSYIHLLKIFLWTISGMFISIIILNYIIAFIGITSWIHWLISGIICIAISLIVSLLWSVIFYKKDFQRFIRIIKNAK